MVAANIRVQDLLSANVYHPVQQESSYLCDVIRYEPQPITTFSLSLPVIIGCTLGAEENRDPCRWVGKSHPQGTQKYHHFRTGLGSQVILQRPGNNKCVTGAIDPLGTSGRLVFPGECT